MDTLGGFDVIRNSKIKIKVSAVDPDVVTYKGILKRFDEDGGSVDETWSPSELVAGVSAVLDDAHGYNFAILPVSKHDTHPNMTVDITVDDPSDHDNQTRDVGDNEPFGWRFLME